MTSRRLGLMAAILLVACSQATATLPPAGRAPAAEVQHIEIQPCEQGAEGWATAIPIRNRRTGQYEYRTVLFSERILEPAYLLCFYADQVGDVPHKVHIH